METQDDNSIMETINILLLQLSLASSLPLGGGKNMQNNYIAASAAAQTIGELTKSLEPKRLKTLDWIILPLIEVL